MRSRLCRCGHDVIAHTLKDISGDDRSKWCWRSDGPCYNCPCPEHRPVETSETMTRLGTEALVTDVRQCLTDALRDQWAPSTVVYGTDEPVGFNSSTDWARHVADVLLSLPGIAIIELPGADSTRYEGDEHEHEDRLAWICDPFAVSHWNYPGVQIYYEGESFEPISIAYARTFAAAILAAANAAERSGVS
jgi:hypothetical protein